MTQTSELGDFLRSRRSRLSPADVGVRSYGPRRVPGLRREELAQLAGVSATYYARLEQGLSANASDSVLEALVGALQLSSDERQHLYNLARPLIAPRRPAPRPEPLGAETRQLAQAITGVAALVVDRRNDVLAWNQLGHRLLAGHLAAAAPDCPGGRPNLLRMLFLDPHTRELYQDWTGEARRAVASYRLIAGPYPDDRALAEIVGELTIKSSVFAGSGPSIGSTTALTAASGSTIRPAAN